MAWTLKERMGERRIGVRSAERSYSLRTNSGDDAAAAWSYAETQLDALISGLQLNDLDVREILPDELYLVDAKWGDYSQPQSSEIGTIKVSSRTSLQPVRILYTRNTVSTTHAEWFNGDAAFDFDGVIGVDTDGEAQGVDALVPVNVLSVEKIVAASSVTSAYQYATEQIVGSVNSLTYRDRVAGTLLCSGVVWNQIDDSAFSVSAEFMFEPNQVNLSVGGLTVPSKKGWQYLWVYLEKRKVAGKSVAQVAQANVEDVYPYSNFASILGF